MGLWTQRNFLATKAGFGKKIEGKGILLEVSVGEKKNQKVVMD